MYFGRAIAFEVLDVNGPTISKFALVVIASAMLSSCGGGSSGLTTVPPVSPGNPNGDQNIAATMLPPHFTVVDLGVNVSPAAINDKNQVVGSATRQAFLYSNGSLTMLGTLPGDTTSAARDINDAGTIVGVSSTLQTFRPVIFAPGGAHALQIPSSSLLTGNGIAVGVNAESNIVVATEAAFPACGLRGFIIYDAAGNIVTPLQTVGGAVAINNAGEVLYTQFLTESGGCAQGTFLPAIYPSNAVVPWPVNAAIGSSELVGENYPTDLNNAGDVVGPYAASTCSPPTTLPCPTGLSYEGFLYHGGVSQEISGPSGFSVQPAALNDQDWVVGSFSSPHNSALGGGFIWSSGRFIDLNTLLPASCANWHITAASDINNEGYIVGSATFNGQEHGVLLKPTN